MTTTPPPPRLDGELLRVGVEDTPDGIAVLRPDGEVDGLTGPGLGTALRDALAGGAAAVVCDLDAITFLSSSGIEVLVRATGEAGERDIAFLVCGGSAATLRVLELTGLLQHLGHRPTVAAALAAVRGAG